MISHKTVMTIDFLRYYDLETYLFEDVHHHFHRDGFLSAFDFFVWSNYELFRDAVGAAGPEGFSLRDKDRYLWGRSSASQLQQEIARCFSSADRPS